MLFRVEISETNSQDAGALILQSPSMHVQQIDLEHGLQRGPFSVLGDREH